MGIFGTLVGGSLGFALGGPFGALLGSMLGSRLSEGDGAVRTRVYSSQQAQAFFAVALTSLAAKVAKADGHVTQDEVDAFDGFLRKGMGMSAQERRAAAEVFNKARDCSTPTVEFCKQVRAILVNQPDRLRDIVTILLMVAMADGKLHRAEEDLIRQISLDLGLSQADYQSCHATFFATTEQPETCPYEILGVATTATDTDVRTAHRRLVRDYHPDVIQSKGLPEEFTAFATEKLVAVNGAWARVKVERGL
jgi:DnaJ like chaperone protein